MKKYKDSFQIRTDSLAAGGQGILAAVENEDTHTKNEKALPPKFGAPLSKNELSPIRTLADDLQTAIAEGNVSLASHAMKSASEREITEAYDVAIPKKNRKRLFSPALIIVLLSLIIFSGSAFLFASKQGISFGNFSPSFPKISFDFNFSFFQKKPKPPTDKTEEVGDDFLPDALLRADHHQVLTFSLDNKKQFEQKLNTQKDSAAPGVTLLTLSASDGEAGSEYLIFADDLLDLLEASVSSSLIRSITDFTFGVITTPNKKSGESFLVAEIHNFEESFAAMLAWERSMPNELFESFHSVQSAVFNSSNSFRDARVNKVDARELTMKTLKTDSDESETEDTPVLIYAFPGKNTLVITESRAALGEIISRLYSTTTEVQ